MDFNSFTTSDWLQFWEIISSSLLSVVAVIIAVCSLKQNKKVLTESNRGHFIVSHQYRPLEKSNLHYLSFKNCGTLPLVVNKITVLNEECVNDNDNIIFIELQNFVDITFVKNQEETICFNYKSFNQDNLKLQVAYTSMGKKYKEDIKINVKQLFKTLK